MFTFTVTPDNGEAFEVKAGSRDVLTWERTGKGKNLMTLRDGLAMGDLYRLAHIAARRQGLFNGDLKEFETTVELDFEEDDEPDPTQPAP